MKNLFPATISIAMAIPLLASCSNASDTPAPETVTVTATPGAPAVASTSGNDEAGDADFEIVDQGFGNGRSSTDAIVIVKAKTPAAVGKLVSLNVNFMGENGDILSTENTVGRFNWEGQELALNTSYSFGGEDNPQTVASIEPTVVLKPYAKPPERPPLPVLEASEVTETSSGTNAAYQFTNEGETLEDSPGASVCYDADGHIVGGSYITVDYVPTGGSIRIESNMYSVSNAASCKAFLNYRTN